jgi:hypothetical protein
VSAIQRKKNDKRNAKRREWREHIETAFISGRQQFSDTWSAERIYLKIQPFIPDDIKMVKAETVHKYINKLKSGKAD